MRTYLTAQITNDLEQHCYARVVVCIYHTQCCRRTHQLIQTVKKLHVSLTVPDPALEVLNFAGHFSVFVFRSNESSC
jgi:hypothetical protein